MVWRRWQRGRRPKEAVSIRLRPTSPRCTRPLVMIQPSSSYPEANKDYLFRAMFTIRDAAQNATANSPMFDGRSGQPRSWMRSSD